jgi:hypothetical protein
MQGRSGDAIGRMLFILMYIQHQKPAPEIRHDGTFIPGCSFDSALNRAG